MAALVTPVLVSIVTYNDAEFLEACLQSVRAQRVPVHLKVFDNHSHDESVTIARRYRAMVTTSAFNAGFCRGHNANLMNEAFEFALVLNADVILQPDYLETILQAMAEMPGCGIAGGKLLRMDERFRPLEQQGHPVLDSTGIYFTPAQRHFDRGGGDLDRGQYDRRQLVFGITGAALLLRRKMLEDLGFGAHVFDESFFAYREDADLAWRAQLRGWDALYEPAAQALHFRKVVPSRRRKLSKLINYHSVKNRYLMRAKNFDWAVRWRCFPYAYLRDIGILGYLLTLERSSLRALFDLWYLRHQLQEKRQVIQNDRRRRPADIARWFAFDPVAFDC